MATRVEYGIFPANQFNARALVVYDDLTKVGRWLGEVTEENRPLYVVRQRTVTVTPWTEIHSEPIPERP
jgi:hypothetical protein